MTVQEIKDKFAPDEEAQDAIWLHGCNHQQHIDLQKMIENGSKSEICVTKISDKTHFQPMGVLVKGQVTLMAKTDIGSKYDPVSGYRVFECRYIKNPENIFTNKYSELQNDNGSYTESFVIPHEIIGVWVMDFMVERAKHDELDKEELDEFIGDYPVTIISSK